jgi:hypothetical protein
MEKRALSYTCVILLALKYIADGGNCECGADVICVGQGPIK